MMSIEPDSCGQGGSQGAWLQAGETGQDAAGERVVAEITGHVDKGRDRKHEALPSSALHPVCHLSLRSNPPHSSLRLERAKRVVGMGPCSWLWERLLEDRQQNSFPSELAEP